MKTNDDVGSRQTTEARDGPIVACFLRLSIMVGEAEMHTQDEELLERRDGFGITLKTPPKWSTNFDTYFDTLT